MFKHTPHLLSGLILMVALASCATSPELSREQVLLQNPQVAQLHSAVQQARDQGADVLAPDGFQKASEQLDAAVQAAARGNAGEADNAAQRGLTLIDEVDRDVAQSSDLLREVLDVRARALDAGAANFYSSETAGLENDLREAARLIERGETSNAKERRPELISGYEKLELKALKEDTVAAAQAALERAREKDAPRHARSTFELAEEELQLALSILEADRTDVEKADDHALRARTLAERSIGIAELVKDFDRRDYSMEDVVLWHQEQLSAIAEPLEQELPFDRSNREAVATLQSAVQELMAQRDATAVASSRYEEALTAEAEQEHMLEQVQGMFAAFEANVYRQRDDVLISAHGLNFPPGTSELQRDNYPLLNKISTAIETFPDSTIQIAGHTDATGGEETNMKLSEERATSVARFLTDVGGIPRERITVVGYGASRPVASNDTADGRAANRRVEVLIDR